MANKKGKGDNSLSDVDEDSMGTVAPRTGGVGDIGEGTGLGDNAGTTASRSDNMDDEMDDDVWDDDDI
jgi:hypothetical protein